MRNDNEINTELATIERQYGEILAIQHPADNESRIYMRTQILVLRARLRTGTRLDPKSIYPIVKMQESDHYGKFLERYIDHTCSWANKDTDDKAPSEVWQIMLDQGYIGHNKHLIKEQITRALANKHH